jgi:putative transposase
LRPEIQIVFGWIFRRLSRAGRERKTMKTSEFSEAQKAFILKQGADGMPVGDICRKTGISQATYFNWKRKYDGLLPTEMRRLKQLEDEAAKLRKIVVDLSLDKEMLQDALRRKLWSPSGSVSWLMRCVGNGGVDSSGVSGGYVHLITTSHIAPDRPSLNSVSERFSRPACGTASDVST